MSFNFRIWNILVSYIECGTPTTPPRVSISFSDHCQGLHTFKFSYNLKLLLLDITVLVLLQIILFRAVTDIILATMEQELSRLIIMINLSRNMLLD